MEYVYPDIEWYTGTSRREGVLPRCPFAFVRGCPRFYQSLSLLGSAGSTQIEPKEDQELLKYWQESHLWPTTREQETWIAGGTPGDPYMYSNFCPEVAYERFGLFATDFARYADEIDRGAAEAHLARIEAPGKDWRWAWSSVTPMHYTGCPLYSPLDLDSSRHGRPGHDRHIPGGVVQAFLWMVWNRHPRSRNVAVIVVLLLGAVFALWASLPERTKERLLHAVPDGPVGQALPPEP